MKSELNRLDPASRREFMLRTAKAALGVSLLPASSRLARADELSGGGKAKRVIYPRPAPPRAQRMPSSPKPLA
jgi:hypothetical protein